jgi:hypothetical protein
MRTASRALTFSFSGAQVWASDFPTKSTRQKSPFADTLPDYLFGRPSMRLRNRQAEGLGGLEVDHQLELRRLLDGRSPGLAPLRILST